MRVDALHRRLVHDVMGLHKAIGHLFPKELPDAQLNKPVNLQAFLNRLNVYTEQFGIHNRIKHDKDVEPGKVCNTAWWYPKEQLPIAGSESAIHILWHTKANARRIVWTKADWRRRRFFFWQFIMHELIHRYQDELREKYHGSKAEALQYAAAAKEFTELHDMQKYLGDYDEIETYAFMTALEIMHWWPNTPVSVACAEAFRMSKRYVTPTFAFFTICFDPDAKPVKTFKRKIRQWLAHMKKNRALYDTLELPSLI